MTCFGINNEGQLVLDYYHEDTDQLEGANIYNGQNSVLWCNFRDAFPDEIEEMYRDLRSNGILNYDELVEQFITKGSDKWSESVYNEDGDFKYISMLRSDGDASNLGQVRGTGEEHLRYFLGNRINYCDGKWYAADYADDYIALRIYTPVDENSVPRTDLAVAANADITVTPYSHMYAGVRYKANGTLYQKRVSANEVTTFEAPNETFNDTETAIYGASQLSSLGDLSPLYCGSINVSKATKLTELIIGNNTDGYSNPNLNDLSVGTNNLLKVLNVRNCPKLTDPLALTGCPNIEEIYAGGSGITGVELTDAGYLKVLELPATVTNLTLKNQIYIESLTLEGYDAIKTLWFENCPTVNSLVILDKATNVERVRLTNVNWSYDNASLLYELIDRKLAGIDENGTNTDTMWVDGKCHIKSITGDEYAYIKESYPYLTITYDELTSQLIFMSEDGETELTRRTIYDGGDGTCPVKSGELETPTKESTAQYHFAFGGWSLTPGGDSDDSALLKIEADRYVYVAFSKELRSYNVNFYNGSTLLQTVVTKYGSDAVYTGDTPIHDTYPDIFEFTGWKPEPTNITGELNTYAQYYDPRVITDDWATIAANCENASYAEKYQIGAYKPVEINYEDGTSETIDFEIIAHDHDELLDDAKRWNDLTPNATGRYAYGVGLYSYNDKLYQLFNDDVREFNPADGTFTKIFSCGLRSYRQITLYKDEIHIFGRHADGNMKHYKYDSASKTVVEASTLPDTMATGQKIVVYNDKLYVISGDYMHVYDGSEWISEYILNIGNGLNTNPVVYNGKIHHIVRDTHYTFDGTTRTKISTIPYSKSDGLDLLVFRDELYMIGGCESNTPTTQCMKFTGSMWVDAGFKLPYTWVTYYKTQPNACVFRDRIYFTNADNNPGKSQTEKIYRLEERGWVDLFPNRITNIGLENLYEYDGTLYNGIYPRDPVTFEVINSQLLPNLPHKSNARYAEYNGELHLVCAETNDDVYHYKYDKVNNVWVEIPTSFINYYSRGQGFIVYNGLLYLFKGNSNSYYTYNGETWSEAYTAPSTFYGSHHLVYNGELHCIFGSSKTNMNQHYKFNGTDWVSVSTVPISCNNSIVIAHKDKIIVIGGSNSPNAWFEFDGDEWSGSTNKLPFAVNITFNTGLGGISFRNKIIVGRGKYPEELYNSTYRLENPKAPLTFLAKNLLKDARPYHNDRRTDNVYWSMSDLRAWCNGDFYESLPNDLQSAIGEVIKVSDTGYIGQSLENVNDKIWIPSLEELGCDDEYNIPGQGSTYSIFTDDNSRVRYPVDGIKSNYPTRSARIRNVLNLHIIYGSSGLKAYAGFNNTSYKPLPGFCIGGNGGASDV